MKKESVLDFTFECEFNTSISFLDVNIKRDNILSFSIYRKSTASNSCLDFKSFTTDRYKSSVIKSYVHRALQICSDWTSFNDEINKFKRILTNNNYPISIIDKQLNLLLNRFKNIKTKEEMKSVVFFFKGQLTSNHLIEEKRLLKIVNDNTQTKDSDSKIKLMIYYKNHKLVNAMKTKLDKFHSNNNVVYQYTCPEDICNNANYIGYTTNLLSVRCKQHENNESIRTHWLDKHNKKPRNILNNMKTIAHFCVVNDLQIAEAISIKEETPMLNQRDKGLTRHLNVR